MKGILNWFVFASMCLGIAALPTPLFSQDEDDGEPAIAASSVGESSKDSTEPKEVADPDEEPLKEMLGAPQTPDTKTEQAPAGSSRGASAPTSKASSSSASTPSNKGLGLAKSPLSGSTASKKPIAPVKASASAAADADDEPGKGAAAIPAGQELVNMEFPEMTDIQDIIKAVAVWTGKNVILDRNVTGKVQIISPKKVTKEEAYQAFLSALNILELTTVETGKVIKIMKVRNAIRDNLKTYMGANWSPRTDEIITQIIPLKYIDGKQLVTTLSRIVSSNSMIAYEPTNTLIVSDSGYKVRRILEIIELLDVQTQQPKVVMVPIKYSDAKGIADKVNQILQSAGQAPGKPGYRSFKILTDDRTNSVIIFGPPMTIADVKDLVKKFDVALEDPAAQATIHVRPLDYADSKKLAATLTALATSKNASAATRRPPTLSPPGRPGESSVADLGNDVKVTSDDATNSLLITGSKSAYNSLNSIIRKLDIRRAQVFIEVDMLDMNVQGNFEAGTSIFAGAAKSDGTGTKTIIGWQAGAMGALTAALATAANTPGGAASGTGATAVANAFTTSPLSVGILSGQSITLPGIGQVTPGALINLLKNDTNSRNLQSPNILTSNNEEAVITVGQKIFYKSSVVTPSGTVSNTPQKEDVDMTLTVKPNLSFSNYVTMNFQIDANKKTGDTPEGLPVIAKRKTKQTVVVKNGQTVVISGLIENSESETFQKIPLLGDIPILGWLFRNSRTENKRNNLVIFLTPHIVHGGEDLAAIYKQKLQERDDYFEQVFGKKGKQTAFYRSLRKPEDGLYRPTKTDELEEKRLKSTTDDLYKAMDLSSDEKDNGVERNLSPEERKKIEEEITVPVPMGGDSGGASSLSGGGGAIEPPPPVAVPEPIVDDEPPPPPPAPGTDN